MRNQAMARKLARRLLVDVSGFRRTATGDYVLPAGTFDEDKDYADTSSEKWVWSVGKVLRPLPSVMADGSRETLEPGTYLASLDGRHYTMGKSTTIECVWLR